jgi:hypothetical protein
MNERKVVEMSFGSSVERGCFLVSQANPWNLFALAEVYL